MACLARHLLLNTGIRMPTFGFGTYQLSGDTARLALDQAFSIGYRHIDTAYSYGNGLEIGDVIADRTRAGKLQRKDVFLCTKVPAVFLDPLDVKLCVDESLEIMKTKYIDLLLIHNPWALKNLGDGNLKPKNDMGELQFKNTDLLNTWSAFESLFKSGRVKAIGLSNCTIDHLEAIWTKSKIKPANIQLECHTYLQQRNINKYSRSRGIRVTAYSPLGAPGIPERHRQTGKEQKPVLLEDPVIGEIAKTNRRSCAQVLLRFLLQSDLAVIPKTQSYDRMIENFKVFDFELSADDIRRIEQLDRGVKYFSFLELSNHPDFIESAEF